MSRRCRVFPFVSLPLCVPPISPNSGCDLPPLPPPITPNQIQWFWRALRSFDQADRAKFLQFVTGTSKVPLQGFAALEGMNGIQKFQIHRDDRSTDRLPSAHTW